MCRCIASVAWVAARLAVRKISAKSLFFIITLTLARYGNSRTVYIFTSIWIGSCDSSTVQCGTIMARSGSCLPLRASM